MSGSLDASLPARVPALRLGRWWCVVADAEAPGAEELVRFVEPWLRTAVRREEFEYVLALGELCWAYATGGALRRTAVSQVLGGSESGVSFLEGMAARHRRIFPPRVPVRRMAGAGA